MAGNLRRALLAIVALAAAAAVGWHLYGKSLRSRYEERIEALRRAGEPTRFEDLARPPIPDGENGARMLEKAQRFLDERRKAPDSAEGLLQTAEHGIVDLDADERATLEAYIDSLGPYFELLERASQRAALQPDLEWSAGPAMRADEIPQLADAYAYLTARVRLDPQDAGHTERAAKAAIVLLDLSRKGRGAFLIGHLVVRRLATGAADILRAAMYRPRFDAALFRRIVDPALERAIPARVPPRRVLVEERTMAIAFVEAVRVGAVSRYTGAPKDDGPIPLWRLPLFYRNANRYLDLAEKAVAASETEPENAPAVAAALRADVGGEDSAITKLAYSHVIAFEKCTKHVAVQRLTRVVMALLEHRQQKGAWPESLDALGEMPEDPYSGRPFLYERTEGGCQIRSALERPPDLAEDDFLLWILDDDQIPAMAR